MPALQPQSKTITLEQYEALPEKKRVEVFDGIVYDMASPSQIHRSISMQLSTVVNNYMVVCDKDKLDEKRCNGAPDFANIVSVQYPFDSIIKVNIYDDLYINFSEIANMLNL